LSYILKHCFDIPLREPYLAKTVYIAELRTTLLKQNDGAAKSQPALKQAGLVHHIHTGMYSSINRFVFSSHYKESDRGGSEHIRNGPMRRASGPPRAEAQSSGKNLNAPNKDAAPQAS
jgi:hypothetical protein